MSIEPTGQGRLWEPVPRASPADGNREAEDRRTMRLLRERAAELATLFGLRYAAITPERPGVNAHYGICYEDGSIRIRLRHARSGRLLKESSLVDTLCHELAHLRHMDHGRRFQHLYRRILAAARRLGYYRPGPPPSERPRQRRLFDPGPCRVAEGRARSEDDAASV